MAARSTASFLTGLAGVLAHEESGEARRFSSRRARQGNDLQDFLDGRPTVEEQADGAQHERLGPARARSGFDGLVVDSVAGSSSVSPRSPRGSP